MKAKAMGKRLVSLLLALVLVVGLVPFTWGEAAALEAESADFISRSDGVWLFPLPDSEYNKFSDWAGCNGWWGDCPFCEGDHYEWGDDWHQTNDGFGHNGIDIGADPNDPVYAAADGKVTYVSYAAGARGTIVIIEHPVGTDSEGRAWSYYSYYQHLNSYSVSKGTEVEAGDLIGRVGNSGGNYGVHLHFGIVLGKSNSCNSEGELTTLEYNYDWVTEPGFHEGRILVNPALNSPAGFPAGSSDVVPPLKAHAGSVMYTFDASEVAIGEINTSEIVEESYPCSIKLEITENCNPYTLPCNSDTAVIYGLTSTALTDKALSPGDIITATELYMNVEGNYWYKVVLEDGTSAYIWSDRCEMYDLILPWIESGSFPENITGAVYLAGTVKTGGSTLNTIRAVVYKGNTTQGDAAIESDIVSVKSNTYPLKGSAVDLSLPFQDLADGYYTLVYLIDFSSYYVENGKLMTTGACSTLGNYHFSFGIPDKCTHSYSNSLTTAATCTKTGIRTYKCSKCSHSYTETIAAVGHSWNNGVITSQPTEQNTGVRTYTCTACGITKTESIPKLDHVHSYNAKLTVPTCTVQGYTTFTCTCGDGYKSNYVDAKGHNYASEVIDATCTDYEKVCYTCTECGDGYTVYSGSYSEWSSTKPSGVDESLIESKTEYRYQTKEYTTSTSGSMDGWTLYDTTTQWSDYGEWSSWSGTAVTANDATKVETRKTYGYYYYLCANCGAHMHGWGITCPTWAGGCGKATISSGSFKQVWSPVSWDNASLKDFHGTGKYYTTIDGERVFKWTEGGSKTQYRYSTRELETVYYFSRWSDWSDWSDIAVSESDSTRVETRTVYRYFKGELAEHSWDDGVMTVEPTEEATGVCTYTCTSCDEIKTESIPKIEHVHSYDSAVHEPTCTEWGYTTYSCRCGNSYTNTYVAAIGHNYVDGSCKNCGAADPDYIAPPAVDPNAAQIVLESKNATTGGTVALELSLLNNPGISVLNLGFVYDSEYLTLKTVENKVSSMTMSSGSAYVWDSDVAYTADGVLATVAFEVAGNAPEGEYEIRIVVLSAADGDLEEFELAAVSGVVTVSNVVYGDANSDGKVSSVDLAMLRRYLANIDPVNGESSIAVQTGADANGDGKVSSVDLAMLRRYLANIDPLTGESSIVLGPKN